MSKYVVWIGAVETDYYIETKEKAEQVAANWREDGYDDVVIDEVD